MFRKCVRSRPKKFSRHFLVASFCKNMAAPYNKKNIICSVEDMNFIFSC